MKIVVCVKRVPDTATRIQVGPDGTDIDSTNVEYVCSPYDEFALEAALQLKEVQGGEVTALTLGPAEAGKELRDCLAKGADKAILLKSDTTGRDSFTTARALADALAEIEADVILFGYKSADADCAAVGSMTGTLLNLPVVTEVTAFEVADGRARAHREVEGGHETVETSLPACFTMQKGKTEPRIASLKGIMMAKKKPLDERDAELGESLTTTHQMAFPAGREPGRILDGGVDAVPELVTYLKNDLKLI